MKPRPLCSLCKTRPAELRGYTKRGAGGAPAGGLSGALAGGGSDREPSYRSRCSACRAAARVAHGLPARRGREGKPGVPRCPACNHPWNACPMCGVVLDPNTAETERKGDRGLLVLREIGNRRGRVSHEEFLAIAARLRYDQAGAEALLGPHLRHVKGDVELTRDGYNLLWDVGLRPPYRLPGHPWTEPSDAPRE